MDRAGCEADGVSEVKIQLHVIYVQLNLHGIYYRGILSIKILKEYRYANHIDLLRNYHSDVL